MLVAGRAFKKLVHETGHLLGLPDLYNYPYPGLDDFDPMGPTALRTDFTAWHKWKLGWLRADQISCLRSGSSTQKLTRIEVPGGLKAVVVPTSASTAFVIEARSVTGNDSRNCNQGVFIYSVDVSIVRRGGVNPIVGRPAKPDFIHQTPRSLAEAQRL